jgi:hypothetical protein
VTYGNSDPAAFTTREEAESSAFSAADTLALNGHPVSVVILPEGLDAGPEDYGAMRERLSVSKAL